MSFQSYKSLDGMVSSDGFNLASLSAQKVNIIGSLQVLDASGNVKIGEDAGLFLTTGTRNILFGSQAGKYATIAQDNIAMGLSLIHISEPTRPY